MEGYKAITNTVLTACSDSRRVRFLAPATSEDAA
jgi:hypothetical protein